MPIITASGPLVVTAYGSRERDLAGLYRAVVIRVLSGKDPASSLRQFRGKTVGGQNLVSNFNQLQGLVLAGVLGETPERSSHVQSVTDYEHKV